LVVQPHSRQRFTDLFVDVESPSLPQVELCDLAGVDNDAGLQVRFGFHDILLSLLSNASDRPSLCHLKPDFSSLGSA
jgi:hypothetical protein